MDGWLHGWMDGWMDSWTDERMDGHSLQLIKHCSFSWSRKYIHSVPSSFHDLMTICFSSICRKQGPQGIYVFVKLIVVLFAIGVANN